MIPVLVFLGLPALYYRSGLSAVFSAGGTDAVSSATLVLPDAPSGEFVILLNRLHHPDTVGEWTAFFSDEDVDVIFEDLSCLTAKSDTAGRELAMRFKARLAENQMSLKSIDGLLLSSRVQWGKYDVVILSKEAADAYDMEKLYEHEDICLIEISETGE